MLDDWSRFVKYSDQQSYDLSKSVYKLIEKIKHSKRFTTQNIKKVVFFLNIGRIFFNSNNTFFFRFKLSALLLILLLFCVFLFSLFRTFL